MGYMYDDWLENKREEYEENRRYSETYVRNCDLCHKELYSGDEVYICHKDDVCICETCYTEEVEKEREHETHCCICGSAYWQEKDGDVYGIDMIESFGEYYCQDCFSREILDD